MNEGLIEERETTGSVIQTVLTFSGWEQYEALRRGVTSGTRAFMAMPFGKPDVDDMYNHFREAARQTGFVLETLEERPKAGLIDDRIRVEIQSARFLIADLTHGNNGAYWEAGYAEGLGKPVIYTCEKKQFRNRRTHFDTNHRLTVQWSRDTPQEAMDSLKATIRATLPDAIYEEASRVAVHG